MDKAIRLIHAGSVTINKAIVTDETAQVHKTNHTQLNGQTLFPRPFQYVLIHKPLNTICSNHNEAYPSLFNYLPEEHSSELHIAGRLDADTTGLVLATDDGHWSFNITRPEKQCRKVYRVGLSSSINDDVIMQFAVGINLHGEQKTTSPALLQVITPYEVLLTITEGRFHQVKRMFAALGNRVVSLHREKIGEVVLDVDIGQWRHLTTAEISSFNLKSSVEREKDV